MDATQTRSSSAEAGRDTAIRIEGELNRGEFLIATRNEFGRLSIFTTESAMLRMDAEFFRVTAPTIQTHDVTHWAQPAHAEPSDDREQHWRQVQVLRILVHRHAKRTDQRLLRLLNRSKIQYTNMEPKMQRPYGK